MSPTHRAEVALLGQWPQGAFPQCRGIDYWSLYTWCPKKASNIGPGAGYQLLWVLKQVPSSIVVSEWSCCDACFFKHNDLFHLFDIIWSKHFTRPQVLYLSTHSWSCTVSRWLLFCAWHLTYTKWLFALPVCWAWFVNWLFKACWQENGHNGAQII